MSTLIEFSGWMQRWWLWREDKFESNYIIFTRLICLNLHKNIGINKFKLLKLNSNTISTLIDYRLLMEWILISSIFICIPQNFALEVGDALDQI